jgi:hypothetical protein
LTTLALVAAGASAPYAHLHADADHDSSHHSGREIHRHGPAEHDHESGHDAEQSTTVAPAAAVPQTVLALDYQPTVSPADRVPTSTVVVTRSVIPLTHRAAKAPPPRSGIRTLVIERGPPR